MRMIAHRKKGEGDHMEAMATEGFAQTCPNVGHFDATTIKERA